MEANPDTPLEVYVAGNIVESQVRLKNGHYSVVRCLDNVHSVLSVRFAHLQNTRRGCGVPLSVPLIESTQVRTLGTCVVPASLLVL